MQQDHNTIPKQPEKWAFGQRESSRDLAQPKCPLFRLFGYQFSMYVWGEG